MRDTFLPFALPDTDEAEVNAVAAKKPDVVVENADITNKTNVPEPGLLAMFGLGLLGVGRKLARRHT